MAAFMGAKNLSDSYKKKKGQRNELNDLRGKNKDLTNENQNFRARIHGMPTSQASNTLGLRDRKTLV